MHLLLHAAAACLSVALARFIVIAALRVFSWAPYASVRRVLMTLWLIVAGIMVATIIVACVVDTKVFWGLFELAAMPLLSFYNPQYTSWQLLGWWVWAPGIVALVVFVVAGVRPQPGIPYQPRAASWGFWSALMHIGLAVAACVMIAAFQDLELRWRFNALRADAARIAASLSPEPVPDAENAAIHYLRAAEKVAPIKEWIMERLDCDDWYDCYSYNLMVSPSDRLLTDDHADAFAEELRALVDEFAKGTSKPRCVFVDPPGEEDAIDAVRRRPDVAHAVSFVMDYVDYQIAEKNAAEAIRCLEMIRHYLQCLPQDQRGYSVGDFAKKLDFLIRRVALLDLAFDRLPVEDLQRLRFSVPFPTEQIEEDTLAWRAAIIYRDLADAYTGSPEDRERLRVDDDVEEDYLGMFGARFYGARDELAVVRKLYTISQHEGSGQPRVRGNQLDSREVYAFDRTRLLPELTRYWFWDYGFIEENRVLANLSIDLVLMKQQSGGWPTSAEEIIETVRDKDAVTLLQEKTYEVKPVADGLIIYPSPNYESEGFNERLRAKIEGYDGSAEWWRDIKDELTSSRQSWVFLGEAHSRIQATKLRESF